MKKYNITISDIRQYTNIIVEAVNIEEAKRKAIREFQETGVEPEWVEATEFKIDGCEIISE